MAGVVEVRLPTLHPGQVRAFRTPGRFKAVRCGRRWGKTDFGKTLAGDAAVKGKLVGWFAPDYKISSEAYNEILSTLDPILKSSSKVEGVMRTTTGGRVDFWTLNNERAGRSRKYDLVILDEAAFTEKNMMDIWEKSIKPTLLDLRGKAVVLSNTNGVDDDNFFYQICNDPKYGFSQYHAPTHENPFLPTDELVKLQLENAPLVYKQEYLAEFVDWSGVAFFSLESMLLSGVAVPMPVRCDAVFATVDTATKTGKEHDATAVTYWGVIKHGFTYQLVVLDWDITQIEGDLLINWLPGVFARLEELAKLTSARLGSVGTHIEDKSSGTILLQAAMRRGWPVAPIDSKLTAMGKSERALSVSGYVYRGLVKICGPAYDKVTTYKKSTRNQWLKQVLGFRIGQKEDDGEDDLLDTMTYGVAIALGNAGGF